MKRVSVVILNWNGVDMLRKFIPSVMDNSVGEGIEICVADNASSDGSLEMLRSEFPVVRLIELDQNYGFAEGYPYRSINPPRRSGIFKIFLIMPT